MAVTKVSGWFSKVGKGVAQVPLKSFDGTPKLDSKGQQEIGNEQYLCEQLTDESISSADAKSYMADTLEACNGDLAFAAEAFRIGWTLKTRRDTGEVDPYIKAARKLISLKLPNYKGMSEEQIADQLRAANQ
jgi:hypothetical protein